MEPPEAKVLLRNIAEKKETTPLERQALGLAVSMIEKMEEFFKEEEEKKTGKPE